MSVLDIWRMPGHLFPALLLLACSVIPVTQAGAANISDEAWRMEAESVISSLSFRDGEIDLPGAPVVVDVPVDFGFLDAEDAEKVLVRVWENPPDTGALGMLVPLEADLLSYQAWGLVIQYLDDGWIRNPDPSQIDFGQLLEEMRRNTRVANLEHGYGGLELLGWAIDPQYDETTHTLYWAKELERKGSRTINFNYRILGRGGVIVVNAVAPAEQAEQVQRELIALVRTIRFKPGFAYHNFEPETDVIAPYGLAGLVSEDLTPISSWFELSSPVIWWFSLALIALALFALASFLMIAKRRRRMGSE